MFVCIINSPHIHNRASIQKELLLLDFLWHTERHELCRPAHLICENAEVAKKMTENMSEAAGCEIRTGETSLFIRRGAQFSPYYTVRTMPYPGFPTDAQAVLMATAVRGKGISAFTENIFESRFRHVDELRRMGADIRLYGKSALVFGVQTLRGADVAASDLRGGAALIIAALAAEGESTVDNMKYVRRGYEDIAGALRGLGAAIEDI